MKIKKKKYGCNAIFLFTDTSSLTYETETNDVWWFSRVEIQVLFK